MSPTLCIIIVYRVNLNKLSRNFVGALRTTTTNCSVSFIDLYSVFPRNFKNVFLPHTNGAKRVFSGGTGKLCIFGHFGLVFIWSCFVSRLLFLLYYVICAPVLTEGTIQTL